MKNTEDYNKELYEKNPKLKGKVYFSRHAAERFNDRFSGEIPRSAGLAILDGMRRKRETGKDRVVGKAHGADIVLAGRKKNIIVTGWDNRENQ
jgi:hypothetical protein